ncbi:MAG: hypothetical protein LCH90_21745 [Proteobacteria bacterium]|nr:hypothetical protein [Pseudomonadota bacterium]
MISSDDEESSRRVGAQSQVVAADFLDLAAVDKDEASLDNRVGGATAFMASAAEPAPIRRRSMMVAPGPIFSAKREFGHCIRLNFGHPADSRLLDAVAAVGRLAAAGGR